MKVAAIKEDATVQEGIQSVGHEDIKKSSKSKIFPLWVMTQGIFTPRKKRDISD